MEKKIDINNNCLDIFRIIATIQVFAGHVFTHFYMACPPMNFVYFVRGVPILFGLCGFLAARSLENKPAKVWLWGRAKRILPAFWGCILVNTVIICFLYKVPSIKDGIIYLATQSLGLNFYTGTWLRGYGVGTPNGVLWTITVQIQFFVIAPLLRKILLREGIKKSTIGIVLLTLLSIMIEKLSAFLPVLVTKIIGVTVLPYLYFLVLGMFIYVYRAKVLPMLEKNRFFILGIYIIWQIALECECASILHVADGVLYSTVSVILLVLLVFAFGFRNKWRMKNDLTYGFYLYHMVFINIVVHLGLGRLEPWYYGITLTLVVAAFTLLAAWLSDRLIDHGIIQRRSIRR